MDVQKKLDEIAATVAAARSMPMSASCMVNRAELLAMLQEVSAELPNSLTQARELLGDREQMVQEAQAEAARIIESAQRERGSLVSETQVALRSKDEAERILAEARREADEIRAEADDYVDSKLANFEVVLTKTIGAVDRGREKLLGRTQDDPAGFGGAGQGVDGDDPDAPERSADPETLRRRADDYVDAKLGAFEGVLTKTLEAVGRGRLKLSGHGAIDDLGAQLAADAERDANGEAGRPTDAEFLAQLAAPVAAEQTDLAAYGYDPQAGAAAVAGTAAGYGYAQQEAGYAYGNDVYAQPAAQTGYADGYAAAPGYPQQQAAAYDYGQGEYRQDEYRQDEYGGQPGYAPQGYAQGYGQEYAAQPGQNALPAPYTPAAPGSQSGYARPAAALDETSFFDTGMIDLDRLRELERGQGR